MLLYNLSMVYLFYHQSFLSVLQFSCCKHAQKNAHFVKKKHLRVLHSFLWFSRQTIIAPFHMFLPESIIGTGLHMLISEFNLNALKLAFWKRR